MHQHQRLNHHLIAVPTVAGCLLCILAASIAVGGQLAVIELKHRPSDEIIPMLTPFLGPEDTLSGQGFQLFIDTTPQNLTRIQAMIARLDRVAKQLTITVVQGENALESLAALAISGNVSIGNQAGGGAGDHRGPQDDSFTVTAHSGQRTSRNSGIQRILVQEGATATLYVGLSAPVAMDSLRHQGMRYHQVTQYRQLITGVQVTPRLSEDGVILEIEARQERPSDDGSTAVQTHLIQTHVQGRLNEWIEIGGILSGQSQTETGTVYGGSNRQTIQTNVFVRVES
jgi:type II secretory pathway component GspD/PulD (secretin)